MRLFILALFGLGLASSLHGADAVLTSGASVAVTLVSTGEPQPGPEPDPVPTPEPTVEPSPPPPPAEAGGFLSRWLANLKARFMRRCENPWADDPPEAPESTASAPGAVESETTRPRASEAEIVEGLEVLVRMRNPRAPSGVPVDGARAERIRLRSDPDCEELEAALVDQLHGNVPARHALAGFAAKAGPDDRRTLAHLVSRLIRVEAGSVAVDGVSSPRARASVEALQALKQQLAP